MKHDELKQQILEAADHGLVLMEKPLDYKWPCGEMLAGYRGNSHCGEKGDEMKYGAPWFLALLLRFEAFLFLVALIMAHQQFKGKQAAYAVLGIALFWTAANFVERIAK